MAPKGSSVREPTTTDRKAAFVTLFCNFKNGEKKVNNFVRVEAQLGVSRQRLKRLWGRTLRNMTEFVKEPQWTNNEMLDALLGGAYGIYTFPDKVYQSGKVGVCGKAVKYEREAF